MKVGKVGIVVIGRNEGERLRRCLSSLIGQAEAVVYVDSGSTDASAGLAAALGADVVRLDLSRPFTAAHARNAGFARLLEALPSTSLVQFVDGDCEVVSGWLSAARSFLDSRPDVAVVCGRRRERFPQRSIYNRLCDIEWDTPVGEARACGGDAMIRAAAFIKAGGFRPDLIAGEEPELCVRLRGLGCRIWRIDADMTLHDAAMTRFSQWWRRSTRAGYAFAQGADLHGSPPERHWVRESRSAKFWGLGLPAIILGAGFVTGPMAAWALLIYPAQVLRLAVRGAGPLRHRFLRAGFLVLGKFPEALGQLKFLRTRRARRGGRQPRLIEYK